MRDTFPSREQLMAMPLLRLKRAVDIQDKEEEELVQEVINIKSMDAPVSIPVYRGDVPDIANKEQEEKWQEIINQREAKQRPSVLADLEHQEPEQPLEAVDAVPVKTSFCNFCDSKGVRHKKECPTLQVAPAVL